MSTSTSWMLTGLQVIHYVSMVREIIHWGRIIIDVANWTIITVRQFMERWGKLRRKPHKDDIEAFAGTEEQYKDKL